MQTWPPKDPDETLWYTVTWDFPDETETVQAATFTVALGSVEIEDQELDGNVARVQLSGGTLGEVCEVLCRVTSNLDGPYDSTQRLRIRRK